MAILLSIAAYLFCGIPTANLLAWALKGKDLRGYGSGAVTASNAGELMGKWATALVGVTDILKGATPVWVAHGLDQSLAVQVSVGLCGIIGHNWSPFLQFQGGRGLTIVIGVLMAVAPVELLLFAIVCVFGITFFRSVPMNLGVATALLPLWAVSLEEPPALVWGTVAMVGLVFLKRLLGNRPQDLPAGDRAKVLWYRLLYDRDTKDRQKWIRRQGPDPLQGPGPLAGSP